MRRDDQPSTMTTVFILVGGKSTRMGTDKASMTVGESSLLGRVVGAVGHLGDIRIVGGDESLLEGLPSTRQTLTHVPDTERDPGPFGALVGALTAERSRSGALDDRAHIVALSCDLALLTSSDVDRLLTSRSSTGADYAVPLVGGSRQWHALALSHGSIPALQDAYRGGVRSLRRGFAGLSECTVVSNDPGFFADVDTPEDVSAAERRLAASGADAIA